MAVAPTRKASMVIVAIVVGIDRCVIMVRMVRRGLAEGWSVGWGWSMRWLAAEELVGCWDGRLRDRF